MSDDTKARQAARRALWDFCDEQTHDGLVAEHLAHLDALVAEQRARAAEQLERALKLPAQGWPELTAWVDEATWTRILAEATPEATPALRAELEAIRPAARRLTDA